MLRCSELGIVSDQDLDSYTMGMIYDMLIEKENDHAEYAFKATQEDINNFFG